MDSFLFLHPLYSLVPDPSQLSRIATHLEILEKKCFIEAPWNLSQIESHLRDHGVLMGFREKEPAGYCLFTENEWEREILRIAVAPEFRRQGYGNILLGRIVDSSGDKQIFLEVDSENFKAIQLYEKFSFQLVDRRKGYYQNGNDALIYYFQRQNATRNLIRQQ